MEIKPNPFVLKYAPWSPSKMDTADQCPYRFYRQYVDPNKVKTIQNADALVGQAVHTALEFVLCGMLPKNALTKAIEKYEVTSIEIDRIWGFQPQIDNFKKKFNNYKRVNKGYDLNLEQKLGITLQNKPVKFFSNDNLFYRGVLDLSMKFTGNNNALILDHKTGKQRDLHYYKKQFDAYKWLLKAKYPNLTGVYIAVHFVAADTIDFVPELQPLTNIEELRNTVVSNLNNATKNATDLTLVKPGPLCSWCSYQDLGCPAHASNTCQTRKNNQR